MRLLNYPCVLLVLVCFSCQQNMQVVTQPTSIIAQGQMPNIIKDNDNTLHLVYGNGGSVLYRSSSDGG